MNKLLLCGAALGLISVIMGALGDHAFALSPEKTESLATAVRYNMVYAVLVIVLALAPTERKLVIPGYIFALGTTAFSLSIYAALITGIESLAYITPIGGLIIMVAWLTTIVFAVKIKRARP